MVCEDTLRVKNLPMDLSDAEKKDFMRHFGAVLVQIITSKAKQRSIVYAQFDSPELAKSVLQRLHQLPVLNSRLCVEYAENDISGTLPKVKSKESLELSNKRHFKTFVNKLNAFNSSVSFNQPPPSHLKYIYPKPNRATINNIAHALASVPKFYTQVLHLMNRMNLPPPFSDVPDPPQVRTVQQNQAVGQQGQNLGQTVQSQGFSHSQAHIQAQVQAQAYSQSQAHNQAQAHSQMQAHNQAQVHSQMQAQLHGQMQAQLHGQMQSYSQTQGHMSTHIQKQESSESELESESEDDANKQKEIIPAKRPASQRKAVKRPKFIKPNVVQQSSKTQPEKPENVFENVPDIQKKSIELKVAPDALEQKSLLEKSQKFEGTIASFGILETSEDKPEEIVEKDEKSETETETENKVITEEELAANRIELKDLNVLPVFKNYHPGAPTCRLYIKNIAKSVESKDLEYIFKRYYVENKDVENPSQFDIRLMQEGRMKGQAFVTLDNVELAQKAVKETNGYILKDKPMVVMFARSAIPKK